MDEANEIEMCRLLDEMKTVAAGKNMEVVLAAAANFVAVCIVMKAQSRDEQEALLKDAIDHMRATLAANEETPPRSGAH
jgi:hypothetical protein